MSSSLSDAPLAPHRFDGGEPPTADWLLTEFLSYVERIGLELYPAQEEAILEVTSGKNVMLNTPTGSGKSLVALAACFCALGFSATFSGAFAGGSAEPQAVSEQTNSIRSSARMKASRA